MTDIDKQELEKLKKENHLLKTQLELINMKESDFIAHKIFKDARTRFTAWIGIVMVVVTAFGITSIHTIIESIEKKVQKYGTEKIISEIKDKFVTENRDQIIKETRESLIPVITAKVENTIRRDLLHTAKSLSVVKSRKTEEISNAIKSEFNKRTYYVILLANTKRYKLTEYLQFLKSTIPDYNDLFKDAEIHNPKKGKYFILTMNTPMSYQQAEKLKEKAVISGVKRYMYLKSRQKLLECL